MVTQYGMSDMGTVQYENGGGNVFLGRDYLAEKNFSDAVAKEIDDAVRKIMDECYSRAKKCLNENRDLLENIAKYLLEVETLNYQDILEIEKSGKLSWWEDKKAKDLETNAKNEKVEVQGNNEVPFSDLKKVVDEHLTKEETKVEEPKEETSNEDESKEETSDSLIDNDSLISDESLISDDKKDEE